MITIPNWVRRTRRLAWLAAAVAFVLVPACSGPQPSEATKAEPSAAVATAAVTRGPVEETLEAFGTVEFDPAKVRTVTLLKAGQVVDVPVVAGEIVRRGQPLLTLGPVPQDSLDMQRARIDVDFAAREVERIRRLLGEKLATNQDLLNAEKQLDTDRAVLASLGDGRGPAPAVVAAPQDGIVAQVLVTRGQVLAAGHEAVQLAAENAIAVRVGFEVGDAPHLAVGLPVLLDPVYAEVGAAPVRAALSRLHRLVDPSTQLVEGLIQLSTPPPWMAAGMKVRVRVVVRSALAAVVIPRNALLDRDGKPGVFV
ncbi:MAG TPA: HlyD family efflux transporter periplasmic adaptor subunit, partial [Thermoanaerobaculaceae bacterium]|nr:HlyD family efflux transporter periplasmic adaptor subunit [Thermoanaerobaculaceae bacterium]